MAALCSLLFLISRKHILVVAKADFLQFLKKPKFPVWCRNDLQQAVELLEDLIINWDKVVKHLKDSRRIPINRSHMQELCIHSFFSFSFSSSICDSSFDFV